LSGGKEDEGKARCGKRDETEESLIWGFANASGKVKAQSGV
jgi:hypothetical protein